MANIVPKLNLNRTPNIIDNTSMVLAKNIRVDIDGSIHKDYSVESLQRVDGVFYDNLLDRIIADFKGQESSDESGITTYYLKLINDALGNYNTSLYSIRQIIPDNKSFYILLTVAAKHIIVRFDEEDDLFHPCDCNWTYNKGTITGTVINNLLGETILVIAEKNDDNNIPLKCINLSKSSHKDDESVYTQTPKVPIINLKYNDIFNYTIPNGVYQFFIRYKIRDNFYTNWFPASKELFAGNINTLTTNFGNIRYTNTNKDSDFSFVLQVNKLIDDYDVNFESFQIGFICSHDDTIVARAWKCFTLDTNIIFFDYKAIDAEEIEITNLTKPIFDIYNVGNVTSFKNKLYISNYKETNFNEDLQEYADKVNIELKYLQYDDCYGSYAVNFEQVKNVKYIKSFIINNTAVTIKGDDGVIYKLLDTSDTYDTDQRKVSDIFNLTNTDTNNHSSLYDLDCYVNKDNLTEKIQVAIEKIKKIPNIITNTIQEPNPATDKPTIKIKINQQQQDVDDIDAAIKYVYNNVAYIKENGNFVDDTYNTIVNNITISYYWEISYQVKKDDDDGVILKPNTDYDIKTTNNTINGKGYAIQNIELKFVADVNKIKVKNLDNLTRCTTLIPYQQYKFYIHFVKNTGEITNGYYCSNAGVVQCNYREACDTIIYPVFSNIVYPKNYIGCFFTIQHCKNIVSTIFDIKATNDKQAYESYCFDINTMLVQNNSNIEIKQDDNTFYGTYHDSNDYNIFKYFGADGVVYIKINDGEYSIDTSKVLYAINNYEAPDNEDVALIKCTPYINGSTFDDYKDLNLLGYLCKLQPLDHDRCYQYYSDGSSTYYKDYDNNNFIELIKYNSSSSIVDTDSDKRLKNFTLINKNNAVFVYSNYNLNYISLVDEPKQALKTYYDYAENATDTNSSKVKTILQILFPSLTLSTIYELSSMYKSYTRKTYSKYKTDEIIKFNNTIRASNLAGDEEKLSIFNFDADTYYNVPTNRGKIVNLVSVGDAILVHTRDSMFKFTGSNTLQSSAGEIQQTETDVFKTGVSEVFGSDFGFAGLQNKTNAIVTEAGYIFYDGDSKIIYMYSGNGQIVKLSDSIEKFFRYNTIKNISFANDYYNNRFFVCVHFNNGDATLSYSFNEESKSFVSLHDFKFSRAFNTKTKCYFINVPISNISHNICRIDKSSYGVYRHLNIQDKIYPYFREIITETYKNDKNEDKSITTYKYNSIIDVIDNTNYETVKTLNYINWNCSIVDDEFPIYDDNKTNFNALASFNEKHPCKTITIYTDTCATKELDCSNISNDKKITDINDSPYYQYPRYNQGFWTLNYFRNILNSNDEFKYLNEYNDGRTNATYRSDNNSLIEGKYFVTRFTFDANKDFKFETINFNYNTKL